MKRREAEQIVIEAAGNWRDELDVNIIPGTYDEEEAAGYQEEVDKLYQALAIVTNELEAEDFHKNDAGDWESGRCPF